jgi:sRNA-binding protein
MAISAKQIKQMQDQVKKLRVENTQLKRLLRQYAGKTRTRFAIKRRAKRIVKLGGLWAGTPEITEQDIAQARKEVWGKFGDRDL